MTIAHNPTPIISHKFDRYKPVLQDIALFWICVTVNVRAKVFSLSNVVSWGTQGCDRLLLGVSMHSSSPDEILGKHISGINDRRSFHLQEPSLTNDLTLQHAVESAKFM